MIQRRSSRYDRYLTDTDYAVYKYISTRRSTTEQVIAGMPGYDTADLKESLRKLRRAEYIRRSGSDPDHKAIWEVS